MLESEDGGYTVIGPLAQMVEAGYLDEADTSSLDENKLVVIDMVDMYQVSDMEEALRILEAEIEE